MSNFSTAGTLPASPPSRGKVQGKGKTTPRAHPASRGEAVASSFSMQGAIGFLAGGLITLIFVGASAVVPFENLETWGRVVGYSLGGALGGAALVWGSSKKHACRSAAFGFALAFLIPAWIAGPAVNRLLTVKIEAYGVGTFLATAIAFTVGFGIAGAIGGAFVLPRLFWAGMVRFGLSAALGAAVAATVPSFNPQGASIESQQLIGLVSALILGNLIPFVIGGYWFGRAMEAEERALRPNRPNLNY